MPRQPEQRGKHKKQCCKQWTEQTALLGCPTGKPPVTEAWTTGETAPDRCAENKEQLKQEQFQGQRNGRKTTKPKAHIRTEEWLKTVCIRNREGQGPESPGACGDQTETDAPIEMGQTQSMTPGQAKRDREGQQNRECEQRPGALKGNTPPVRQQERLSDGKPGQTGEDHQHTQQHEKREG